MDDYYEHNCMLMVKGENVRDYGYGWYFEQTREEKGTDTIENIKFCPKCGTDLNAEWKRKHPDYPGIEKPQTPDQRQQEFNREMDNAVLNTVILSIKNDPKYKSLFAAILADLMKEYNAKFRDALDVDRTR